MFNGLSVYHRFILIKYDLIGQCVFINDYLSCLLSEWVFVTTEIIILLFFYLIFPKQTMLTSFLGYQVQQLKAKKIKEKY